VLRAGSGIRAALARRPRAPAEDIAWLGVIPAAAITWVALSWLAPRLGPRLFPPPAYNAFPEWALLFVPEPVEETRFLLAIGIPVLLAAAVLVFGSARPGNRRLDPLVIAVQAAALAFAIAALTRQTRDAWLLPDYFEPLLLSVPNLVAGAVIGLILTALLVRPPRTDWQRARALAERLRGRPAIPLTVAVVLTALWLLPAVVTDTTLAGSGVITPAHIPFQFEDYLAVVNGRTPLVDFVPSYAQLLPIAASPLLPIFDLSITSFSIIQVTLGALALVAVYAAFVQVTERPWAALGLYVPFLAISLFPWDAAGPVHDFTGTYYAQLPNRYLGPLVALWLCLRSVRRGSPPLWFVFFVAGLTLLNNFEFGLPCLAALLIAVAISRDRSAPRIRTAIVEVAAGLVAAFVLVSAVTLIRVGELPDLSILSYWSRVFGRQGYGLLPMPPYGLHWAVFLTYAGALLLAAVRYVRAASDRTLTAALAFIGIFGLATGQYYAGRSDPIDLILLFPMWGIAVALLVWATILSVREAGGAGLPQRRHLVAVLAVMTAFGVMISAVSRFPLPWDQVERLSDGGPATYELSAEQAYIESRTDPGESVLILGTPLDHRVAERAGVSNVSPWGGALLSPREVIRARDNLDEEGGQKLFEVINLPSMQAFLPQVGFTLVDEDPSTGLRQWRLTDS